MYRIKYKKRGSNKWIYKNYKFRVMMSRSIRALLKYNYIVERIWK